MNIEPGKMAFRCFEGEDPQKVCDEANDFIEKLDGTRYVIGHVTSNLATVEGRARLTLLLHVMAPVRAAAAVPGRPRLVN